MYNELYHHGILGQKWGVRRYQNKDGSLTPAGQKRYGAYESEGREALTNRIKEDMKRETFEEGIKNRYMEKGMDEDKASKRAKTINTIKNVLIAAGGVAASAVGGSALYSHISSIVRNNQFWNASYEEASRSYTEYYNIINSFDFRKHLNEQYPDNKAYSEAIKKYESGLSTRSKDIDDSYKHLKGIFGWHPGI